MTTNINPQAKAAQDAARRGDGTFGTQVRNEAEGSLMDAARPDTPTAESVLTRLTTTLGCLAEAQAEYDKTTKEGVYESVRDFEFLEDTQLSLGAEALHAAPDAVAVIEAQQARIAELEAQLAAAQSSAGSDAYQDFFDAGMNAQEQAVVDLRDQVREAFPDAYYFTLEEHDQGSGMMTHGVFDRDGNRLDDPFGSNYFEDDGTASFIDPGSSNSLESGLPESLSGQTHRFEVFEVNPQN